MATSGESLASFLPVRLLARTAREFRGPHEERSSGAILFADIVGFTQLTARYAERGEAGLERLSGILDQAFSAYAESVAATGGEVVFFAGDALLSHWPAENAAELYRAVQAAHESARGMLAREFEERPELHIGIGAGALWTARVGGFEERWEFLLGGDAVREAALAGTRAGPREMRMGERAAALVARGARDPEPERTAATGSDSSLNSPAPDSERASSPPLDRNELLALLPRIVLERWGTRDKRWFGELRNITAVFVRLDGLNENAPDALSRFQEVIHTAQEVCRGFTNDPGQLLLDDKGLVLVLPFGRPLNTHLDDANRAVRAALALERKLQPLGVSCAMGIATGRAFCGVLGRGTRHVYATVGPVMNLAARLMSAASQGLLCAVDREFCAGLSGVEVSDGPEFRPKGFADVQPTLRLSASGPIPWQRQELFGRQREQMTLAKRLEDLQLGRGGAVLIRGPGGIGKTALVLDFVERAKERALPVFIGHAEPGEGQAPYASWRRVFLSILTGHSDAASAVTTEAVRERLAAWGRQEYAGLLRDPLRLDLTESETTRQLSGPARAQATLDLLADILAELTPAGSVVVLEDAHWMDSASQKLLLHAVRTLRGLLCLVTARADGHGPLDAVAGSPSVSQLDLCPLADPHMRLLAQRLVEQEHLDDSSLGALLERGQGSPLFVVEYALLLRDTAQSGQSASKLGQSRSAPSTIDAMITSRLDRLTPDEALTLKAASVLGSNFTWQHLAAVLGGAGASVSEPDVLLPLIQQKLLVRATDQTDRFGFPHETIRSVVYELMLVGQRQALHGLAARAFRANREDRVAAATLAWHFYLANEFSSALEWSEKAGDEALEVGAYVEAISQFGRCLSLVEAKHATAPVSRQAHWQRRLADAEAGVGNLQSRSARAQLGLELLGKPTRQSPAHALVKLIANVQPSADTRSAVPRADDATPSDDVTGLYRHLAHVAYFDSDGMKLLSYAVAAVHSSTARTPAADVCAALAELGGALGVGGQPRLARHYLARALAQAQATQDALSRGFVNMVRCLYFVGIGRWHEAREAMERCQQDAERTKNQLTWANAQIVRFWIAYHTEQPSAEAEAAATALTARSRRIQNRQQEAWALRGFALLELRRARQRSALDVLEHGADVLRAHSDSSELMSTYAVWAWARAACGDHAGASRDLNMAVGLLSRMRRPTGHANVVGLDAALNALSLLDSGRNVETDAFRAALRALDQHRRIFAIGQPIYHRWLGFWHEARGHSARAKKAWQRGLSLSRELGMPHVARALEAALGTAP
jgi:class 3 adenylate cyclase